MIDEIMSEVHAIKDAIATRHNCDLQSIYEEIKRGEAEMRAAGAKLIPPPDAGSLPAPTVLQRTRFSRR